MNFLDCINDEKDKKEIFEELSKINKYKNYLLTNKTTSGEIQKFIIDTINKYREKIEVANYYTKPKDEISGNQYDTLCTLEAMIRQYVIIKYIEKIGG